MIPIFIILVMALIPLMKPAAMIRLSLEKVLIWIICHLNGLIIT